MKQNKGGRPLKFKTVDELEEAIHEYFSKCDKEREPYTITGLCLSLDVDRKTLLNYEERDEFFHTIKKAKLMVENYLEKRLINDNSTTGIIFNLKNNFDWKDKQEIEHSGKVKLEDVLDE